MKKIKFDLNKDKMMKIGIGTLASVVALMFFSFMHRVVVSPPVDPLVENERNNQEEKAIQVSILNACGVSGLAAKTREYLRQRGFDVVEITNYPEVLNKSVICDRLGNPDTAGQVAYAMGISDSLIISKIDSGLFVNASIIIGNDFYQLKPFN